MEMSLVSLVVMVLLVVMGLIYLIFHLWVSSASPKYTLPKGYMKEVPLVAFHIPVKNEPPSLLDRLLSSISQLRYPKEKIKVVVICDDKDPKPIEEVCKKAQAKLDVTFIHRGVTRGFKAGALNEALKVDSDVVVVLDVDSIVPQDFLIKALPSLYGSDDVAAVFTRWESINVKESLLSEAYSFGQNFFTRGLFRGFQARRINFMLLGSGCLVKREVLMKLGGWSERCIAEDLELGVRLRLNGYKILYNDLAHILIECPSRYSDFKTQQRRWACGASQLLLKYFKSILTSKLKAPEKLSLIIYLTQYWALALIGFSIILLPLLAFFGGEPPLLPLLPILIFSISVLAVYGRELMKYKVGDITFNTLQGIKVLGRTAAITLAMSFDSLLYSLRPFMGIRCEWRVTPKGPSKGPSKNMLKTEIGLTVLLLIALVLSIINSYLILTIWSTIYLAALIYVIVKRFE